MLARVGTGNPTDEEVRAALDRVIASEGSRSSPQLIAFLRFVVEATLRGERPLKKSPGCAGGRMLFRGPCINENVAEVRSPVASRCQAWLTPAHNRGRQPVSSHESRSRYPAKGPHRATPLLRKPRCPRTATRPERQRRQALAAE